MAIGTVISNGTKRSIRLLEDQTTAKAAPSDSEDGVPCYVTRADMAKGEEAEKGVCFLGRDAGQSTLMIKGRVSVRASLDLDGVTVNLDTIIETLAPNDDSVTITTVHSAGAPNAGSLTRVGNAFTFTYKGGTTTVANFEAAVAALTGDDQLIGVKTAGTGGNILADTDDEVVDEPIETFAAVTIVATATLWGYLAEADAWFEIPVNGGTVGTPVALAETSTDQINFQQRFENLGHYDRIDIELASPAAGSSFDAWIVSGRYGE